MTPIEALKKILEVTEDCKRLPRIEQIRDIATAALKEAEFTVEVVIPPLEENGSCNTFCPLINICEWQNWLECDWFPVVSAGCPRYKEEGK